MAVSEGQAGRFRIIVQLGVTTVYYFMKKTLQLCLHFPNLRVLSPYTRAIRSPKIVQLELPSSTFFPLSYLGLFGEDHSL
jgi:hypothetical protein